MPESSEESEALLKRLQAVATEGLEVAPRIHRKQGEPGMGWRVKTDEEIWAWIFSKLSVELPCLCWKWLSIKSGVYPRVKYGSRKVLCSRLVYELFYGSIPDRFEVMHECDDTTCLFPWHLKAGTYDENMKEMKARHRQTNVVRGENHHSHKLTERQVIEMRSLKACGVPTRDLVRIFEISRSNVKKTCRGLKWSHLPLAHGVNPAAHGIHL